MRSVIGALEAGVAGGGDLQFHVAVLHQGNLGRHDLDVKRHRLGNGHGHAVADVVPDLAIVVAADEHRLLDQPALDRAIAFFVPPDNLDQGRLRLRIGRRRKQHRRRVLIAGDRQHLRGNLLRQILHFQAHVAAKILPLGADHQGHPVPLRHRGDHVDVGRSLGQADRQPRLDRRDFHAVDELRPAAAHLVGDADHVLIVLGRGEADVAVRPVAVVVVGDELALDAGDVQRAVQRRAELPGEDADIEGLPLLRRKDPAVGVARRDR